MLTLLTICLVLLALVVLGQWLLANPGEVIVHWLDYEITLHVVVVAFGLLTLVLVAGFFSASLWQMLTWGKRRRVRKKFRTLESGLKQLTLGVSALALGNEKAAQEALDKAATLLPGQPLPQLLNAQLLQRQGKLEDAKHQFESLMHHEATAELATRRLIEQHVSAREWNEARKLAEEAHTQTPKDRWLTLVLIDLYAREGNTQGMLALTEGWQWQSPLEKSERHRYAALAHFLAAGKQPNPHKKESSLRHAIGYAPDFMPAVIAYAEVARADNNLRAARKQLRQTWLKYPSALLIEPILQTFDEESPRGQRRLLSQFLKGELGVTHHLLAARHAMQLGDVTAAKASAEHALALEESKPILSLMAKIETLVNGADAANRWLARASDAADPETWVCDDCGATHEAWQPHCKSCTHFDRLRFSKPESRITSVSLSANSHP